MPLAASEAWAPVLEAGVSQCIPEDNEFQLRLTSVWLIKRPCLLNSSLSWFSQESNYSFKGRLAPRGTSGL